MSLLDSILSKAKKADLDAGIHEKCIITKVQSRGRKNKDGQAINRNCFTTFAKINDKGDITAEKEVSWFDLDITSEYVRSNFSEQMLQLVNILECFFEPSDIDSIFNPILEEHGIIDDDSLNTILADKASTKKLMEEISENYAANMESVLNDKENVLRVKLVYDSKGKNIQIPSYGAFVEAVSVKKEDSKLKLSKVEQENEVKSHNLTTMTSKPAGNI